MLGRYQAFILQIFKVYQPIANRIKGITVEIGGDTTKLLLKCFSEQEYVHLRFTTMNGHKSNGFYFIGAKRQCKTRIKNNILREQLKEETEKA